MFLSNRDTENQTSPIGELKNTNSKITNFKLGYAKYYNHSYINFMYLFI